MKVLRLALALMLSASLLGCRKKSPAGTEEEVPLNPSPLAGGFEGKILIRVEPKGEEQAPFDVDLSLKKDRFRVEVPRSLDKENRLGGGKAWLVFRASEKKGFVALEAQKQAYVLDLEKSAADIHRAIPNQVAPGGPPSDAAPKVKRLGKRHVIAGILCEDWELTKDEQRVIVCMASDDASWFKIPARALPNDLALAAELFDGKHFPLRMVVFQRESEAVHIEVKKLDPRHLPESDFDVPKGYTSVDVGEMLRGLKMPSDNR